MSCVCIEEALRNNMASLRLVLTFGVSTVVVNAVRMSSMSCVRMEDKGDEQRGATALLKANTVYMSSISFVSSRKKQSVRGHWWHRE